MIPYDDLCAALEAYATRTRGAAAGTRPPPSAQAGVASSAEPGGYDPPTADVMMPDGEAPVAGRRSRSGGEDEEGTHMDGMPPPLAPVFDDKSNELDIGDVLSDEESGN
jgi:hypothetical protein